MKSIHDVENMPPKAIELFEAAGYMDAQTIFNHSISDITAELIKANNVLSIIDAEPNREMVTEWLQPLEAEYGKIIEEEDEPEIDPRMLVEPKEILHTPFAIPVSEKFINEHQINLSELPSGNVRFLDKERAIAFLNDQKSAPERSHVVMEKVSSNITDKKTELFDNSVLSTKYKKVLDKSRILDTETFNTKGSKVTPRERSDQENLTQNTRKETNKGVKPESKFYVRGVLHKNTPRFKSSCRALILANLFIFLSFAITSLVLVDPEKYGWAVWAPLLAVLAIFFYIIAIQRSSCPICSQKQFSPKRCLKHKSAHRWPIIGYMIPTAFHALIFKWFRCVFCGTSVRLKE